MLLQELNFVPHSDIVKPWVLLSISAVWTCQFVLTGTVPFIFSSLPWRVSLTSKRRTETTRPIFWSNRQKSYLSRTSDWDEVSSPVFSLLSSSIWPVCMYLFSSLTVDGEIKLHPLSEISILSSFRFPRNLKTQSIFGALLNQLEMSLNYSLGSVKASWRAYLGVINLLRRKRVELPSSWQRSINWVSWLWATFILYFVSPA
jgi:hypothetical protein